MQNSSKWFSGHTERQAVDWYKSDMSPSVREPHPTTGSVTQSLSSMLLRLTYAKALVPPASREAQVEEFSAGPDKMQQYLMLELPCYLTFLWMMHW